MGTPKTTAGPLGSSDLLTTGISEDRQECVTRFAGDM